MTRQMNSAGLDLIKHFEGFYPDVYICPAGILTIGFGHTQGVRRGQSVTKDEAEQLLREDLTIAKKAVERYITVPLSDNQFAALVSFTFNLGGGNLKTSTLARKLNEGNYDVVPTELARWVKGGGKTLAGLVLRRADEGKLFLHPDDEPLSDEVPLMPQRVESFNGNVRYQLSRGYLSDDIVLEQGSVDDRGDEKYSGLSQNVPDEYVYTLQKDLKRLGFTEAGQPDGAFGRNTKKALEAFQNLAETGRTGVVDSATKDAISFWLEHGYTKDDLPSHKGAVPVTLMDETHLIMPRVPHFSQGDTRWARRTLGKNSSISRGGCAICCISMILRFYGQNVTPRTLDAYLDANSGYSGNNVIWGVAGKFNLSGSDSKLNYGRMLGNQNELEKALSERVEKNVPTIVRVDYGIDQDLTYNHFVVCVGKTVDGHFIMNDPATNRGDGYADLSAENIIQKTKRKNGYRIVQIDYYDLN